MSNNQTKKRHFLKSLPMLGIGVITYIVILVILVMGVTPVQYDISIGYPAPVTVYATKDVEDTVTTEAMRDIAAAQVEPSYKSVDHDVDGEVLADIRTVFDQVRALGNEYMQSTSDDAALQEVNTKSPLALTKNMLTALSEISDDDYAKLTEFCIEQVQEALTAYLPEGQEEATINRIQRKLAEEQYPQELIDLCGGVLSVCVKPNMLIDTETTEENQAKARESVETVTLVNREVIVRQGEIVTEAEYQMISDLGLLADDTIDLILIGGLALLDFMFCAMIALYLVLFEQTMLRDYRGTLLLSITIILEMLLCFLIRGFNTYVMPVSLAAIVLCVLFNRRIALFTNTLMSFIICLLVPSEYLFTTTMFSIMLMTLSAGTAAALVFSKRQLRSDILLSGVVIGVTNFACTMGVGMINSANLNTTLQNAAWSIVSGVIAAVLAIGLQVLMELIFNLPTNAKLIDLSNPNQKLLRQLLMEAPGTYHHSIIVANLAEAAATAVGGNGLLARVGAYYHDIGKLKRPLYYKENQNSDNPHDHTDPRVSAAILTAHTRDGAAMAIRERLPQPIIDIIRQHHGDSLALYFYDKAVKLYGNDVDQNAFRYEGPRPQSIEAACVMLADTIEAATRTLKDPTPESMEAQIRKLVNAKMTDGQLNESPLTFADLDKICSTFVTVLTGVFHQRIEYPDVPIPERVRESTESSDQSGKEETAVNESEEAKNGN